MGLRVSWHLRGRGKAKPSRPAPLHRELGLAAGVVVRKIHRVIKVLVLIIRKGPISQRRGERDLREDRSTVARGGAGGVSQTLLVMVMGKSGPDRQFGTEDPLFPTSGNMSSTSFCRAAAVPNPSKLFLLVFSSRTPYLGRSARVRGHHQGSDVPFLAKPAWILAWPTMSEWMTERMGSRHNHCEPGGKSSWHFIPKRSLRFRQALP